tara:strand:- start:90 stop:1214 length:1125 start_codon:yes stop_codon:yes gene_type:complete
MKVALLHDFFEKPGLSGGGEALALTVAKAFKADVYTAYVHPEFKIPEGLNVQQIIPNAASTNKGKKTLDIMDAFEKLDLTEKGYDLYIFSGTNCITASGKHHPNLLYCHTPPRWLYDLKEWFDSHSNMIQRVALNMLRKKVFPRDQYYMRQFDKIVANSETVKKRLGKYYEPSLMENVDVVYSFLDMTKYNNYRKKNKIAKKEEFYLSTARLDPLKRVDMIVEAFQRMPDKKLVVLSSGPMLEKIQTMSDNYDNVAVLGWVPEEKLIQLMNDCVCTIQMPINEDLGLGPMESMAMGKPCIVANEGGPAETVFHEKTGLLIKPKVDELIGAVKSMTPQKAAKMKRSCLSRAGYFSKDKFILRMKKAADEAMKKHV